MERIIASRSKRAIDLSSGAKWVDCPLPCRDRWPPRRCLAAFRPFYRFCEPGAEPWLSNAHACMPNRHSGTARLPSGIGRRTGGDAIGARKSRCSTRRQQLQRFANRHFNLRSLRKRTHETPVPHCSDRKLASQALRIATFTHDLHAAIAAARPGFETASLP